MSTNIEVNKLSVKELLATGKKKKFVIPEYQRPYAWTEEQIQTLFDDLVEFAENIQGQEEEESYFLGTIVSYENEDKEQEIIDGQQRITSLFLFLRAIYKKFTAMTETQRAVQLRSDIENSLWMTDRLTGQVNEDSILISSRVMGETGNQVFANILKTGETDSSQQDRYSRNFRLFEQLIDSYATKNPVMFTEFISVLLDRAILLPITADSQETALTIFSTLNDRGLALSDADIFKAKIYNHLDIEDKKQFIEEWQSLDEAATGADENIQKLFYYYMFYLRAGENDRKTTTPGMRKYYAANRFEKLYRDDLLDNLSAILNLWIVVNNRVSIEEIWSENKEILQVLDTLSSYPNEFWKYPVVIYYLRHREEERFEEYFLLFLRRLAAILATRYIVTPTINAVKSDIVSLNAEAYQSMIPRFQFKLVDNVELREKLKIPNRNIINLLLKVLAYKHQENLLPNKWEIEHILPQKWDTNYFPKTPEQEVRQLVEYLGNKIPLEKKLNIIASNNYFQKKKESYQKSQIVWAKGFAQEHSKWDIEDIRVRSLRLSDELLEIFEAWGFNQQDTDFEDEVTQFEIEIPADKVDNYRIFLETLSQDDSDEKRQQFLTLLNQ